jgi:hypothetical protein
MQLKRARRESAPGCQETTRVHQPGGQADVSLVVTPEIPVNWEGRCQYP